MSSESTPITPARFAEALKDLPMSSLHLKVLELRNSIAHLDYSNEQLRPYAEGREVPVSTSSPDSPTTTSAQGEGQRQPDPDCVEAIKENEEVIERMQERIRLVRVEVESRGFSWTEFQSKEEADALAAEGRASAQAESQAPATNGINGDHTIEAVERANRDHTDTNSSEPTSSETTTGSNPWTDGTFQAGVIRNGQLIMSSSAVQPPGLGVSRTSASTSTVPMPGSASGGSISDEELRQRMEQQLRTLDDDEDAEGGLHL